MDPITIMAIAAVALPLIQGMMGGGKGGGGMQMPPMGRSPQVIPPGMPPTPTASKGPAELDIKTPGMGGDDPFMRYLQSLQGGM